MPNHSTDAPKQIQDMVGKQFGLWTILSISHRIKYPKCYHYHFACRCACGTSRIIPKGNLVRGFSKSCGCGPKKPRKPKHGLSGKPEFRIHCHLIRRCQNENDNRYYCYGERGITVCERWLGERGFQNFYADMGPRPSADHSIDRIDNNGNYEPSNCRWATRKQQARNKRNNRILKFHDQAKTVSAWSEITGISTACLAGRIKRGWTAEECLTIMPKVGFKRGRGQSYEATFFLY